MDNLGTPADSCSAEVDASFAWEVLHFYRHSVSLVGSTSAARTLLDMHFEPQSRLGSSLRCLDILAGVRHTEELEVAGACSVPRAGFVLHGASVCSAALAAPGSGLAVGRLHWDTAVPALASGAARKVTVSLHMASEKAFQGDMASVTAVILAGMQHPPVVPASLAKSDWDDWDAKPYEAVAAVAVQARVRHCVFANCCRS